VRQQNIDPRTVSITNRLEGKTSLGCQLSTNKGVGVGGINYPPSYLFSWAPVVESFS
jgi:hypothetical protein